MCLQTIQAERHQPKNTVRKIKRMSYKPITEDFRNLISFTITIILGNQTILSLKPKNKRKTS